MPETIPVTNEHVTASLAGLIHRPYADAGTAAASDLAAETIRYLNHAAAKGGITNPATIAALTAGLAIAAHQLPQLLNTIGEWLRAENTAGRIVDDHRSPDQLTARIRAAIAQTADTADKLAAGLAAIHNLTATLHTAEAAREQEGPDDRQGTGSSTGDSSSSYPPTTPSTAGELDEFPRAGSSASTT